MKILVVAPRWVGDVVLSQSLLKQLRKQDPAATIDILAAPRTAVLYSFMPEVNECLELSTTSRKLGLASRLSMAFHIRRRKYDWAIVMTGSFKSAVVPWLAGVPCRTGTTHEFRSKLINDNRVADISKFPLSIDRACLLALDKNEMVQPGFAEWPTFTCNAEDSAITLERLAVKTGKQKIIALAPGSDGGEAKRWPAECYAETANGLLNNGFRVMLIGSATDIEISHRIQAATQNRCIDLCGKTSLEQAVHLISQAAAVVCNDSGLMHVASALGKPVVAIFGPTHSGHTPPLSDSAQIISLRIPCSPCYERKCPLGHHKCMREIRPNSVIEDVQRIVNPGKS